MEQGNSQQAARFIISNSKGALFDRAARAFGACLESALVERFAYENLDDDSAEKGAELVARQLPDGRVILLGGKGALTSRPHLPGATYQPTDFAPLGQVADAPIGIAVGARSRWGTLKDLFNEAKQKPDTISFSTPHAFHTQRLAMAAFGADHGLKFKFTALPGSNDTALARVSDGTIDFAVLAAHNYMKPAAEGSIRVLGIASRERVPFLSDVPTFKEQGYDLVSALWIGLLARAGSPPERLAALRQGMKQAFADPSARPAVAALNVVPAFHDHEEFDRRIREDFDTHRRVLKQLGALPA